MDRSNPHNNLFVDVFSSPREAAGYLALTLSPGLAALLDWEKIRKVPGSFINPGLRQRHTDLLFVVPFKGAPHPLRPDGVVYVLLEHQSSPDERMLFQTMEYQIRIWGQWQKDHPELYRLPMVLAVVVYQGEAAWAAPRTLSELVLPPPGYDLEPEPLTSQTRLQIQDLRELDDQSLPGLALGRLALLMLKYGRTGRLWARLDHPLPIEDLRYILGRSYGLESLQTLFSYITQVSDPDRDLSPQEIRRFIQTHLGEQYMETYRTYAQMWKQEGRQEGEVWGQHQERLANLRLLLEDRFGPLSVQVEQRLQEADYQTLGVWMQRFLQADSLDEVLASS